MTTFVGIGGGDYAYTTDVRNNPAHREAFFALARQVFGLDFSPWHAAGWWDATLYRPHLLLQGGAAVANISANLMDFRLDGALFHTIQLGTVMTAPSHEGQGLSRFLMESVLMEYGGRCDALWLLANSAVRDFYPRFGFVLAPQIIFSGPLPLARANPEPTARRLNMDDPADQAILLACYARGNPYSALSFTGNPGLLMFHCNGPMRNCVYYIEACTTAFVAETRGRDLHLADVFGPGSVSLAQVLASAVWPGATRVVYGFTPSDTSGLSPLPADDEDTLFIQKGGENPFAARPLFFPTLSHA